MLKLKPHLAPSQYRFIDPDTRKEFFAKDRQTLLIQIVSYRNQNKLEVIPELEAVLDNFLCSLPENRGKCMEAPLQRGWFTYLKGGLALLEYILFKKIATDDIAEKRAKICIDCKLNTFPDKDAFVKWSDSIAEATSGKKCSLHNHLGNCEGCTCPLRAKVWYGGEIKLTRKEFDAMKAAKKKSDETQNVLCWQVAEVVKNAK